MAILVSEVWVVAKLELQAFTHCKLYPKRLNPKPPKPKLNPNGSGFSGF